MLRRTLCLIAGLALLLLAAAPADAGAAEVGPQVERRAPARFPVALPGCDPRCIRGEMIPRGRVLLSRTVRLDPRERRTPIRFACPGGRRFQTFGQLTSGDADVGLLIPDDQLPYANRSRVRLFGQRGIQPLSRPSTGTVYALCVRR